MRRHAAVGLVVVLGCASRHEPRAPLASQSSDARCTLRISERGTFVDGNHVSTAEAVAFCKRIGQAMVVIEDSVPCSEWEPTRSALRREGVVIHMRGPVGDFRQPIVAGNAPPSKPTRIATPRCN